MYIIKYNLNMNQLIIIFILNLLTSTLSQLKYILARKSSSWQLYLIVAIDSIFYLYSLSLVIGNGRNSIEGMIVLTLGKLLGITFANIIEKKMIKTIYSYELFVKEIETTRLIEKFCFDNDISVVTLKGSSLEIDKYIVNMHINSKQLLKIDQFLKEHDISNTSFTTTISHTFGKISDRT